MSIHETAEIAPNAHVAESASVWHYAQIREEAIVGEHAVIGRGVYLGSGVVVGPMSKIQNGALVYDPAHIGEGVFIGPGAILTNDEYPRAINPGGQQKSATDWVPVGVDVQRGASIGAGAVCVAPVTIGKWAMVAAGAVVVSDVPSFGLVAGVPAQQKGWVGRSGHRLEPGTESGQWLCGQTGERYWEWDGVLSMWTEDRHE